MVLQGFSTGIIVILIFMFVLWIASLVLKNSSIVDIFWGVGFILAAFAYAVISSGDPIRRILLLSLITIWGLRLSIHIYLRNSGKGEDFRYQAWRKEHGTNWWWRSFFQVFLLQGMLLWIISAPLLIGMSSATRIGLLDGIGLLVWIIGFFFESVGDYQLTRFRSDPNNKGKVLRSGLWGITRHPNYFGDATQWWGYYLIALSAGGWWTLFSPILMTILLVRISGVALLEKSLAVNKPGYREYLESVPAFIPWFPKKPAR